MTGTFVADAQGAAEPPAVRLDLTGLPASSVTISRVDGAGALSVVRNADPATLTGGAWVGFDYEAPFSQIVRYVADDGSGGTWETLSVALVPDRPWLIHPGDPSLSMPVTVVRVGDRTRSVNRGVHRPLGRATAVTVTDGARHSAEFDLTVRTTGVAEEQALLDLLADAETLLLQVTYSGVERARYEWVSIGDVGDSYLVDWLGSEWNVWTLPCTVTDVPTGPLIPPRTWQQVIDGYATWADVVAAYPTWRALIADS